MKKKVIYPGNFDPLTIGHLWVIEEVATSCLFDELIIVVVDNLDKTCLISLEDRVQLIKNETKAFGMVSVKKLLPGQLLVDFAYKNKAETLVRGIRNISDFTYESDMQEINKYLMTDCDLNIFYLIPPFRYRHISSSLIRSLLKTNCDIDRYKEYLPYSVFNYLLRRSHNL